MAQEFVLPDIGEGLTEAEIVTWLVAVGDEIQDGQVLCEVETAKAVVEMPSPFSGVLLHQGGAEGDTIDVGAILAVIGDPDEVWEPPASKSRDAPVARAADAPPVSRSEPIHAMPVVRRLAAEHGVDLSAVAGTGPSGRITREDVLAHAAVAPASGGPEVETVRLSATRRAIADHLSRSWREIPHVTTYDDVDVTVFLETRRALADARGAAVPLEALMILAVIPALKTHPEFNATLAGEDLILHQRYDIGIAVDTQDGLLVPVLRGAGDATLDDLTKQIGALATAAQSRSLKPDQLRGGTFTISNIGALGGGHGTPIIPLGTTSILSFGRALDTPVAIRGRVEIAPIMPISLSYDHRVIDGALGRRFVDTLTGALADPSTFAAR